MRQLASSSGFAVRRRSDNFPATGLNISEAAQNDDTVNLTEKKRKALRAQNDDTVNLTVNKRSA